MGWALVKFLARRCKIRKTTMKKGEGDKEGHLGFGDVDGGHDRGVDGRIRSRSNCDIVE